MVQSLFKTAIFLFQSFHLLEHEMIVEFQLEKLFQRDVISGILQEFQQKHNFPDIFLVKNPLAFDQLTGDFLLQQRGFEFFADVVIGIQDGNITILQRCVEFRVFQHIGFLGMSQGFNLFDDKFDFGIIIVKGAKFDVRRKQSGFSRRDGLNGFFLKMMPAQEVRGDVNNTLRRAIVFIEYNHVVPAGEILEVTGDILDMRPAPGENGLVIIGHDKNIAVLLRQRPHDVVLNRIGILKFIHQNGVETFLFCFD